MTVASDNQFPKVTLAESAAPGTPSAGLAYIYASTTGTPYFVDDTGTETSMIGTATASSGSGLASDFAVRSAGNVTLNSTTWADVDTGTDLSVAAVAGDVLQIGYDAVLGANAVGVGFNFEMVNSGNLATAASRGFYTIESTDGTLSSGTWLYTVVSGDISGGNVAVRLQYLTNTASNRTLYATGNYYLHFWVVNLGQ